MINWHDIDTVLLDMDGTLLDLHFDNHFWLEYMPAKYAEKQGISLDEAKQHLEPIFAQTSGQLQWYCLDYWGKTLDLDMVAIKQEIAHLITLRPSAEAFLTALHQSKKHVVLITNAHQDSLSLKLERIALAHYFDHMITSHKYGYPKEQPPFWEHLANDIHFDPSHALFIDDSLPILRSARDYGIKHLFAISQPDSRLPPKPTEEFTGIDSYLSLLPIDD
ncbi:GMP/IMP nucleotidase [Zooshikella ganghwensis]|uniref:GMP/IMP nucleotidase n=1 Tax=Zooshikella ganghwensis TaxID=202772 RepID=UPI0003FEE0B0|nr:GMP/IMP nucleotidase [Zooshikella ganghwensis]